MATETTTQQCHTCMYTKFNVFSIKIPLSSSRNCIIIIFFTEAAVWLSPPAIFLVTFLLSLSPRSGCGSGHADAPLLQDRLCQQ